MAVLPTQDRENVSADYRNTFEAGESLGTIKVEVTQLISDLDDFLDANADVINTAIRESIRTKFNARQKARALVWVIRRRFEVT